MNTLIIDFKDYNLREPQEVIRIFSMSYEKDSVKASLWEIFRGYMMNPEKDKLSLNITDEEIVELFDSLLDLVGAVQSLNHITNSG